MVGLDDRHPRAGARWEDIMDELNKAYDRAFQAAFNIGARVMPWRKAIRVKGRDSIRNIPKLLALRKVQKPIVVTDPGLVKLGIVQRVLDVLSGAEVKYSLFDTVEPNPSVATVNAIQAQYFKDKCDSIIAIGGGSAMDAAKAAGARVAFPEKSVNELGGLLKIYKKIPPLIAVPTTAGTGSETTIAALITDGETHHKYAIMDFHLIPLYAVLDPKLTEGLPPAITAWTGMDALTHGIEAYLCWTYNTAESLRFAEEAVKAIFENLEKAYKDGHDLDARMAMQDAAFKAGFAFTRAGVGNVHAVAHTLGGLYNTQHGLANAVILPVVLKDYGPAVHAKLAKLSRIAGVSGSGDDAEAANAFIAEICRMNERMAIPKAFDFIKDEDIPQMCEWADKEANPLYPVPVVYTREDFARIIEAVRVKPGAEEN